MALIKCKECGKSMSAQAKTCPHCGIKNDVRTCPECNNEVKEEVKNTDLVTDVSIRLQGKIVYTTIVLKDDTSVDKAKEIASNTLDNYSKEELSFYDFSFFLEWKGEEKDTVITGNKHHNLEAITWVKS